LFCFFLVFMMKKTQRRDQKTIGQSWSKPSLNGGIFQEINYNVTITCGVSKPTNTTGGPHRAYLVLTVGWQVWFFTFESPFGHWSPGYHPSDLGKFYGASVFLIMFPVESPFLLIKNHVKPISKPQFLVNSASTMAKRHLKQTSPISWPGSIRETLDVWLGNGGLYLGKSWN
jgi:hypothetical protein